MKTRTFPALVLSFIGLLISSGAASAANCRVTKAADTNDGSCTAGDCSLREAVAEPTCSTIDFSLDLAGQPVTVTLGDMVINRTLGINGYGADAITIASNGVFRIFYIAGSGNATITGVKLTGGGGNGTGAGGGGAIRNGGGSLILNGVYLTGNSSQGGAAVGGNALIVNSTIAGNVSGPGTFDAALSPGTSLIIYNSTVCDNAGPGIASGAFIYMLNSTIAFNGPTGVLVDDLGILRTGNSIVLGYHNGGHNFGGDIESQGSNIGSYAPGSWPIGFTGADMVGVDPVLGPLEYNGGHLPTRALLAASPGIDVANNSLAINAPLPTDQRGYLRIFDGNGNGQGTVDIGAFEFGSSAALAPVTVAGRVLGAVSGNPVRSQTVAITDLLGNTRTTISSSLGWFVFDDLPAGFVYRVSVKGRRGVQLRTIFADRDLSDVDILVPGV